MRSLFGRCEARCGHDDRDFVRAHTGAPLVWRTFWQEEDDGEDVPREEFSGNEIPLDELVREHIVLELPMQPLCGDACPGIPIPAHVRPPADVFAEPGAVDPRLAPLQRLRDNVPPISDFQSQPEAPSGTPARKQPGRKTKSNKE
jgi:uncharacterized protein